MRTILIESVSNKGVSLIEKFKELHGEYILSDSGVLLIEATEIVEQRETASKRIVFKRLV